jgi:hypothetical protein
MEGMNFHLFFIFFNFSVYSPVVAGSGLHDFSVLPAGSHRLFGFRGGERLHCSSR